MDAPNKPMAGCASPPATLEFVVKTRIVKADWCKTDCGQTNGYTSHWVIIKVMSIIAQCLASDSKSFLFFSKLYGN